MWTRMTILAALVCALLGSALTGRAADAAITELLLGKIAPLTVTMKEMGGEWRRFAAGAPSASMVDGLFTSAATTISLTLPASEYYTRGQTVVAGDVTYLIAYKRTQPVFDVVRAVTEKDIPAPELLTPETPCTLCLLDLATLGSLQTITPVDLAQEIARSKAGGGVPSKRTMENDLRAALQLIRAAVTQFQTDTGYFPASLSDIVRQKGKDARGVDTNGDPLTGDAITVVAKEYRGPYLKPTGGINNSGLPVNPFVEVAATDPLYRKVNTHWLFWPNTGLVTVPTALAEQTTVDGVTYGDL